MKIEDLSIAVFADCCVCKGRGTVEETSALKPRRKIYPECPRCFGFGKKPIFIPLAELEVKFEQDGWTRRSPSIEGNIGRWLEKQEETE